MEGIQEQEIQKLVADLSCGPKSQVCQQAQEKLVSMGPAVLPYIVQALKSTDAATEWQLVKILEKLADPNSVDLLISLLADSNFDIQWMAAETLARIGDKSLVPLLNLLVQQGNSVSIRNNAHYILHRISILKNYYEILKPLNMAMNSPEADLKVPLAAFEVLKQLKAKG